MSGGNLQPAPRSRTAIGREWVYKPNSVSGGCVTVYVSLVGLSRHLRAGYVSTRLRRHLLMLDVLVTSPPPGTAPAWHNPTDVYGLLHSFRTAPWPTALPVDRRCNPEPTIAWPGNTACSPLRKCPMHCPRAVQIVLSDAGGAHPGNAVRQQTAPKQMALYSRIALLAANGPSTAAHVAGLHCGRLRGRMYRPDGCITAAILPSPCTVFVQALWTPPQHTAASAPPSGEAPY